MLRPLSMAFWQFPGKLKIHLRSMLLKVISLPPTERVMNVVPELSACTWFARTSVVTSPVQDWKENWFRFNPNNVEFLRYSGYDSDDLAHLVLPSIIFPAPGPAEKESPRAAQLLILGGPINVRVVNVALPASTYSEGIAAEPRATVRVETSKCPKRRSTLTADGNEKKHQAQLPGASSRCRHGHEDIVPMPTVKVSK